MWWAVVPSVAALGVTVLAPTALGPICKWWTFGIPRDRSIWFPQDLAYLRRDKRLCPIPGKIYHNTTRLFDEEDLPIESK